MISKSVSKLHYYYMGSQQYLQLTQPFSRSVWKSWELAPNTDKLVPLPEWISVSISEAGSQQYCWNFSALIVQILAVVTTLRPWSNENINTQLN